MTLQRLISLNNEAIEHLRQGNCGAAFTRWRQSLRDDALQNRANAAAGAAQRGTAGNGTRDQTSVQAAQQRIHSVEMSQDSVWGFVLRACPDVTFPIFCRAFTLANTTALNSQEQATTTATEEQEDPMALLSFINSAIILYNLALCYHLCGISGEARGRDHRLQQADRIYDMAERSVTQALLLLVDLEEEESESYHMLLMLAFGLNVNKGHIHSHFLHEGELRECQNKIVAIQNQAQTVNEQRPWSPLGEQDSQYVLRILFESTSMNIPGHASAA